MSVWRERARKAIARLTADLPADATLAQRRKALRGKGWGAHQGTKWGRMMWGQEVSKYLAQFGDEAAAERVRKYRANRGRSTASKAGRAGFEWPADVAFPFREQPVTVAVDRAAAGSDFSVEHVIRDGRVVDFIVHKPGSTNA